MGLFPSDSGSENITVKIVWLKMVTYLLTYLLVLLVLTGI
jgi:hypothetical protein